MGKWIIKTLLLLSILMFLLYDYGFFIGHNGKLLFSSNELETISDVYSRLDEAEYLKYYSSPITLNDSDGKTYFLMIVTENKLYSIEVTDTMLYSITSRAPSVEVIHHHPIQLWFYIILAVTILVFPLMRKIEEN